MIRKLDESHRTLLVEFLNRAPEQNIYMLGNLASLGVHHPLTEFWGDLDVAAEGSGETEPSRLHAVLNRYMRGWSVYGESAADWRGLAAILDRHPEPAERLQDNPGGIATFAPYLRHYRAERREVEQLMTLAATDFRPTATPPHVSVRPATLADADALTAFYAHAGPMRRTKAAVERPLRDGYVWLAEGNDKEGQDAILCAALTNAVSDRYAMIGGVFTTESQRGRGLAQAVCSALCTALLADHITPALYWIADDAGHIYRKLGFRPIGNWTSIWLTSTLEQPRD